MALKYSLCLTSLHPSPGDCDLRTVPVLCLTEVIRFSVTKHLSGTAGRGKVYVGSRLPSEFPGAHPALVAPPLLRQKPLGRQHMLVGGGREGPGPGPGPGPPPVPVAFLPAPATSSGQGPGRGPASFTHGPCASSQALAVWESFQMAFFQCVMCT